MKIDELIVDLEEWATCKEAVGEGFLADSLRKAASTIKLLWEVAQDSTNEKYKRQFDEWRDREKVFLAVEGLKKDDVQ